ncbi:hypothetical protein [Rossellomorea sp. y25]
MEVTLENSQYTRYLSEFAELNENLGRFEYTFTTPLREETSLKFLLGATGEVLGAHDVVIDNVELK